MMTADEDVERQKFALRELFRSYNNADKETVKAQVWWCGAMRCGMFPGTNEHRCPDSGQPAINPSSANANRLIAFSIVLASQPVVFSWTSVSRLVNANKRHKILTHTHG